MVEVAVSKDERSLAWPLDVIADLGARTPATLELSQAEQRRPARDCFKVPTRPAALPQLYDECAAPVGGAADIR
jgi:hypothetical protein